jgi:NAD(P)-dependent dehydrogenase (short-subunit alcohol dehydrogenase family)
MTTVALVTGGASGVGAATVMALAARGARVAVCDIDKRGADVANEAGATFFALDVSDADAWSETVAAIQEELGPIDAAHLNAGLMSAGPESPIEAAMDLGQIPLDRFQRVIDVNIGGIALGLRALWPSMTARGSGAIVATASAAGLTPYPFDPLYSATKHAIVGLVRSAAPVLAARGVRLQAICPGGIDTPLLPDYAHAAGVPLLTPAQVAAAVTDLLLVPRDGLVFETDYDHPYAVPV